MSNSFYSLPIRYSRKHERIENKAQNAELILSVGRGGVNRTNRVILIQNERQAAEQQMMNIAFKANRRQSQRDLRAAWAEKRNNLSQK